MRKIYIVLVVAVIIGFTVIISYFYPAPTSQAPNVTLKQISTTLRVGVTECDDLSKYEGKYDRVLYASWLNDSVLRVETAVQSNCIYYVRNPAYEVNGNYLTLSYELYNDNPKMLASCDCAHIIVYEISELEKKNYQISIKE